MNAYCQRQGKSLSTLRFLYDGARINENDTPEQVHPAFLQVERVSWTWKMKTRLT